MPCHSPSTTAADVPEVMDTSVTARSHICTCRSSQAANVASGDLANGGLDVVPAMYTLGGSPAWGPAWVHPGCTQGVYLPGRSTEGYRHPGYPSGYLRLATFPRKTCRNRPLSDRSGWLVHRWIMDKLYHSVQIRAETWDYPHGHGPYCRKVWDIDCFTLFLVIPGREVPSSLDI